MMGESSAMYLMEEKTHGHGLFASRAIKAGTQIISEKPIISVSKDEARAGPEHKCVISKASQLSLDDQDRLMALYHNPKKLHEFSFLRGQPCPGTDLDSACVLAKFYTNAANITTGGLQSGLFATFCRMNHSCTPNTCWVYDEASGMMEVYAVKDIGEGEEILDSYTDVAIAREERAKALSNWGFCCDCVACEGPEASKHEERRRRISQLREILDIYEQQRRGEDVASFAQVPKTDLQALAVAEESVILLAAEGLVEELGVAHGRCTKFARRAGLTDVADAHEEKEYEILVITTGEYTG